MGSIGFWNVMGMNSENKQKDIRWFLHNNNIGIFGLLETRVRLSSINKVQQGIRNEWTMVNNIGSHDGGRVWIIWDATNYKVEVLSCEAQVINTKVTFLPTGDIWWMSVVYGFNKANERIHLWQSLQLMQHVVSGPWVVMGDFNSVLAMDERIGSEISVAEMRDFQECVDACGIGDIPAQGSFFTWNNKQEVGDMFFSRIDRAMVNIEWLLKYSDTITMFHPEGLFDHSPCTMTLKPDCLVKKLQRLKRPLKELNGFAYAQIETTAKLAQVMLQDAKVKLHLDLTNLVLQKEAKEVVVLYKEREDVKRSFLAQKAKIQWAADGDGNSKYFHRQLLGTCKPMTKVHVPTVGKGRMLKQVNETTLTLIQKKSRPKSVADFKPITYCNGIYKVIYKIVCNRLARVLPSIVRENQSAFIKGRDIMDNILICQDLVRLYKRKTCSPRCIMKIDLKKAYDSIEWDYIKQMLKALGFPRRFILWIMEYLYRKPTFSGLEIASLEDGRKTHAWEIMKTKVNQIKQGKRGIRQGDPMSPLLFTLCMKYLSRILAQRGQNLYHSYLRAFATFSMAYCLVMNCEKYDIYFNGMRDEEVQYILNIYGFREGQCPFRYQGIPISHKRMAIRDCSRNYLWGGSDQFHKRPNVAWEKEWLTYTPPIHSSWSRRMICKTKDKWKDGFCTGIWTEQNVYSVENGYSWMQGSQCNVLEASEMLAGEQYAYCGNYGMESTLEV
ncbi:uncharacterized protein LOC141601959 [Silene latifolia]|uniref:uncharacterized protein LOC141601959 n=1 Tax=Silene latifolia TaxID=37657 RepID=UPI003D77E6DC